MAESFVERRKRELGLTPSAISSTPKIIEKPKESDFVTRRKMELGLITDTRAHDAQTKLTTQYKDATAGKNQFATDKLANAPIIQHNNNTPDVEPTWNGVLDNPVTRTVGKGLAVASKAYDKVSHAPGINQATGAGAGAFSEIAKDNKPAVNKPLWKDITDNVMDVLHVGQTIQNPANLVTDLFKNKGVKGAVNSLVKAPISAVKGVLNPDEARLNLNKSLENKSLVNKLIVGSAADPLSYVPLPSVRGIKTASSAVGDAFERFAARNKEAPIDFEQYLQASKNRNEISLGQIDRGEQGIVDKFNFMERQTNKNQPLQLNPSRAEVRQNAAQARSTLQPNTTPIQGRGTVETMTLPASNTPRIINDIKKQADALIKPPTSRRGLITYAEQHLEVPNAELIKMNDKDLYELGQMIRSSTNMEAVQAKIAAEQGHNWTELVSGKSVTGNVEAPLNRLQFPSKVEKPKPLVGSGGPVEEIVTKTPKAKPRKTIEAFVNGNKEVAATTVKPKVTAIPKVEPVLVKPPTVKPKIEVVRTPGIRANFRNQVKNGNLSSQMRGKIGNTDQTYERVTNAGSVERANEAIKNLPRAESDFLLNEAGGADHIANGYRLMQKLDDLGEHSRALVVSKKLAEDLTKSGQTTQAANILSKLSPEGQLLNLVRQAEKNGKTVSVADSVEFKAKAKIVREKSAAGVQANQFTEILDRAAKGEPLTPDDIKKMSDYLANAEKTIKPPKVIKVVDDLPNELKEPRKRDRIVSYLDEVEKEALARIKARKSTLNASLPIGEWKDHAIVVAAQLAKGTIKASTHVEDLVKLFGEEIRPVATQVFQKAQGLVKGVSSNIASNNITKANESFKRISGQAKEVNVQEKVVEKYLKENPKVSPKDIDTLRDLAKSITRLSNDSRIEADIAMQKILNSYEKSGVWDKVLSVRYMAMLLNSHTQSINAASGPIMASVGHAADVFGTMVDIAMHATLKTPRSTTLYGTNPLKFIARYFKNLKVGGKAGAQGVNPAGIQSTNEIRGLAFPNLRNPLTFIPSVAERTLGAVAKGADYATYKSVYDSEMVKQGFLDAINSGIKRSDKRAIKAHIEKFVNEPTEAAMLNADRIGKNTTFQRSDTTGGKLANYLNTSPTLVKPAVNAIFPFVRTPVNIASTAVTMTPAGIIKGLFQLTSKSKASQREAIRTLSLGVTGTGISAVGYYLFNLGIITGANDSGDKDVDSIRDQAGKGKYRFNQSGLTRYLSALLDGEGSEAAEKAAKYQEGDHAFDYNKLQPLAFPLAIGASWAQNKDKSELGRLGSAGGDAYGSLFGMSTLKGVQSVFQPSFGGTQGEKALGVPSRIAESFFKSFSPSALAQEARRQDPIVRKTPFNDGIVTNTKEYFKSRTPGLSQSLPPNKTTLGINKMNAAGFSGQYANPYKSEIAAYSQAAVIISDLIDRTGDTTLAPSAPEKKVAGKDKKTGEHVSLPIPQDRYEQLQEELGQAIIIKILAIPKNDSDGKKAEKITKIYADAREKEMNKIKKELGIRVN